MQLRRPPRLTRRGLLVAGAGAVAAAATGAARAEPGPAAPAPRLFVLGDSWAAGLHADPQRALGQVAARLLGWPVEVDAASGTGYLATTGSAGSYADRLRDAVPDDAREPGVAVLQGGSNDHGRSSADLLAAVRVTTALLAERRPGLRIVMLGPGPDPEPVTAQQRAVDAVLARAAGRARVPYLSMLRQHWIPAGRADAVLDPHHHHPTVAGQRYLGLRLAEALRALHPDLAVPTDSSPRTGRA